MTRTGLRGPETLNNSITEMLPMIIQSLMFSWLGLALVFTFALCRAASGPTPKPGFQDETSASGNSDNLSP